MTTIVKRRRRHLPERDAVYAPPQSRAAQPEPDTAGAGSGSGDNTWSPHRLYKRSAENRRILALELLAAAIVKAEQCATREEFEAFEQELRSVRAATWGQVPWSGATDPARFEEHAFDMLRAFTDRPAIYPNRNNQPLAVIFDQGKWRPEE